MVVRKGCGLPGIDLEGHEGNYDMIVYNCLCLVTKKDGRHIFLCDIWKINRSIYLFQLLPVTCR